MVEVCACCYIKEMMLQFDYVQGTLWPEPQDLGKMKNQSCVQIRVSGFSWWVTRLSAIFKVLTVSFAVIVATGCDDSIHYCVVGRC